MRKSLFVFLSAVLTAVTVLAQTPARPGTSPLPRPAAKPKGTPTFGTDPAQKPATPTTPAAPAAATDQPKLEVIEAILVKVNGEIVTKTELEARQIAALRGRQSQNMTDDDIKKALAELTPDLIVDCIDELLLLQRGKELGYKVTDDQFKRVVENIRKENKLENDEQFNAALKQEGLTMEVLRRNLEKSMIINQVRQSEVVSKIGITEDEARVYYSSHRNEFTTPASLTLREFLAAVRTDPKGANVAAEEAAKAKADGVLKRVRAGESFAKLISELSDAPSKANGGLVGPLAPTELDAAIQAMVGPLKQGGTTEVFRTPGGFAILMVEARTDAVVKTFEAARDEIADKVFGGKQREEFEKYVARLRSEAIIEWKNEEMKRLYVAALSAPPKAQGVQQ
jgi:parvulin-like peptidyl-prolyl isomerase